MQHVKCPQASLLDKAKSHGIPPKSKHSSGAEGSQWLLEETLQSWHLSSISMPQQHMAGNIAERSTEKKES